MTMTINQFPALANALMKETGKQPEASSSYSGRVSRPSGGSNDSQQQSFKPSMELPAGFSNRRMTTDRRKGDRRHSARDRRKSVRTERMRPRHTYKPGPATASMLEQQPAKAMSPTAAYASAVGGQPNVSAPVDDVIDLLREESLYLQIMLMRGRFRKESVHRHAIFSRLEMVQAALQRELEQEALRLKQQHGGAGRCGNLIDERG